MNIYIHEFKTKIKSVLIWSVSVSALLLVFMSIAPSFSANAVLMSEVMSKFPKELLIAFGMTEIDFSTILGFFGLIFLFCQICLAIQAANYGFGLVSIEETEFTADFLLARPVSRTKIITAKFLAAITSLTITNIVVWIISFAGLGLFGSGEDYNKIAVVTLLASIILFQLVFFAVGMVISLLVKRVRNITPFSMGLVFGVYILNAFGGMLGETSLEVISPFKHFDPNYILVNEAFDPLVFISVGVTLISIVASYVLYNRRNILSAV